MKIVIMTGAGISTESGLATFRDDDGFWSKYDLNEVATLDGYLRNPEMVLEFYNLRRSNAASAEPNAAHFALADLQERYDGEVAIVMQNIDNMNERAGSRSVIHMHGGLFRTLCAVCGARWDSPMLMTVRDRCSECNAPRTRPDIVWFGEIPYHLERIFRLLGSADLCLSIGTFGQVHPAASFVHEASSGGALTLELNLEHTEVSAAFDETVLGPATDIVLQWVDRLLSPQRGFSPVRWHRCKSSIVAVSRS